MMESSAIFNAMPSDPADSPKREQSGCVVKTTGCLCLEGGEPTPPIFLDGAVVRIGYYSDTLPRLIIIMNKERLKSFKFADGERTPVTLAVLGAEYRAGVRTTARSVSVMISPDVVDCSGNRLRLVELLFKCGLTGNRVRLQIENGSGEIAITIGPHRG